MSVMSNTNLLRLPEVMKRIGFKRGYIYKMMLEEKFPRPIKLGNRSIAWTSTSIDAWIESIQGNSTGGDK